MTAVFDIDRLKSVKLKRFRTHRIKRGDLFSKYRREAQRILDRPGRGIQEEREYNSPFFNREKWEQSFIAQRIAQLPKKSVNDKILRRARHYIEHPLSNIGGNITADEVNQAVADIVWQGILLLEDLFSLNIGLVIERDIENAARRYWEIQGILNEDDHIFDF